MLEIFKPPVHSVLAISLTEIFDTLCALESTFHDMNLCPHLECLVYHKDLCNGRLGKNQRFLCFPLDVLANLPIDQFFIDEKRMIEMIFLSDLHLGIKNPKPGVSADDLLTKLGDPWGCKGRFIELVFTFISYFFQQSTNQLW